MQAPAMRRVFVTGGTGFVGRAVVQALGAEGYAVRCLVRRGSERDLRGLGAIERVEGDVMARQSLDEGMAGCNAVIHLVGIIREHPASGVTFERVHTQGTINVLEAAATVGARRYVHMSALGTRVGAHSRYHRTKWAAEEVVRASPIPWTIFRPSIIYGRGDGFVSMLAGMIERLPVVPVIGTGRQRLQPVPVAHVAQGFVRALALDASVKHTYDVGGPEPVTDNAADRAEYTQHVLSFLRVLDAEVPAADARRARGGADTEEARLLAAQVARARALPDYWQRFETLSARFLAEPASSGGERRGVLARLFGRS